MINIFLDSYKIKVKRKGTNSPLYNNVSLKRPYPIVMGYFTKRPAE